MEDLAAYIRTHLDYDKVVQEMFDDGIINKGRVIVLSLFNNAVCDRLPNSKHKILECFNKNMNRILLNFNEYEELINLFIDNKTYTHVTSYWKIYRQHMLWHSLRS